jgi:hypothetical protein
MNSFLFMKFRETVRLKNLKFETRKNFKVKVVQNLNLKTVLKKVSIKHCLNTIHISLGKVWGWVRVKSPA